MNESELEVLTIIELVKEANAPKLMLETLNNVHNRQWQEIADLFRSFSIADYLK